MMTRSVFPTFLLATFLIAGTTAANPAVVALADRDRELIGGINLCAAYDGIVQEIPDGEDNCVCDGRAVACTFSNICPNGDESSCATNLKMKMDF